MRTDLGSAEQKRSPLPNINRGENYNCWNLPEDFRPAWTETTCGLAGRLQRWEAESVIPAEAGIQIL